MFYPLTLNQLKAWDSRITISSDGILYPHAQIFCDQLTLFLREAVSFLVNSAEFQMPKPIRLIYQCTSPYPRIAW